jgi:PAS domain S-box-containing protein
MRARLFRGLATVIGVLLVIVAVAWQLAIEPALRDGVARSQLEVARRAADQIEHFLDRRVGELSAAAEMGRLWEGPPDRQREVLYRLLKLSPPIEEVTLVDAAGREVFRLSRSRPYGPGDLGTITRREPFRRAMSGDVHIGDVYHARTAEPFVTIAVPVRFTARDVRGILSAEVNLKSLWDAVAHVKVGESGSGFVVDRVARLIAHPDQSRVLLGSNMIDHARVGQALGRADVDTGPGEIVTGQHGRPVLSTFAAVPSAPWVVVVEEPVETALAGVRRTERLAIGLLVVTLGGLFGVSYAFSRRITRPMRQLQEGAARVATGDLEHRLEIATGDELEAVARQFNDMADQLRSARTDLERKVVEKTRELAALYALIIPITPADHLQAVLDGALEKLLEITGADAGAIALQGGAGEEHRLAAFRGLAAEHGQPGAAGAEPRVVADLRQEAGPGAAALVRDGFLSVAHLPLTVPGHELGTVTLASRVMGRFGPGQVELLAALGRHVSMALENARLYHETEQTRDFLESLTRSSADAIFVTAEHGQVTYFSPGAEQIFGYTAAEVVGQRAADYYRGGVAEARALMERLREDGKIRDHETAFRAADGRWVEVSLSVSLLRGADGAVSGTLGVAHDVTAHRQLEAQFRQAQKMEAVGRLAGGVAHDFNNLLTIISGRSDLLLRLLEGPARAQAVEIKNAAVRAGALTRQLLAFSRRQVLQPRVLDVNPVVTGIAPMLRRLIGEDIDLALGLGPGPACVHADPVQLEQVLLNLAVNSRDAMPSGGRLAIDTAAGTLDGSTAAGDGQLEPGDYVMLVVRDSGIGMDAGTLARIFEPFFTTKAAGKGTGLGLATVYGIVKQHRGHIAVESQPGQGATFRVYLPRVAATPEMLATGAPPAPVSRGSETVLVVEDEDAVRHLVRTGPC